MPTAGNAPPRPGSRRIAGRYLLTGALGSGAMGVVWSGFDEVLKREVAVKELTVPRGVPAADRADLRERVLREARTLGGLSHPNVITVYDVVEDGGEPFVVLELLVSRSLSELVTDRGRLGAAEAAAVGTAVGAALRSAHRAGITHRDVKPGNVLVAGDGRIKLTDFGIARNVADTTMTTTGLVLGSPAYIAPEVAAGGPVTSAADLWGLGATLFAVVEGHPPYDVHGDAIATITEVVAGPVPRTSVRGPVAEVIAGLMRKDPGRRLPLAEVLRRLSPLLPDPTLPRFPRDEPRARANAGVPAPRSPATPPGSGRVPAPRPAGERVPAPRRGPLTSRQQPGGPPEAAAPLAVEPGPLPGRPPQPDLREPGQPARVLDPPPARAAGSSRRRRPARVAASAVLLVLAVLVGVAGGWTATRLVAGQSPLTAPPVDVPDQAVALVTHTDPAGFTVPVPPGWSDPTIREGEEANPVARFVSPDGTADLRVDRFTGNRADPDAFAATLTARRLGVDRVTVEEPLRAVPSSQTYELRYRTESAEGERLVWARLVPSGEDLWVLRLAGVGGPEQAELFGRIADGFRPA